MSRPTFAALLAAAVMVVATAAPALAGSPTFDSFTDPPSDDVVADCGSYQIREITTFSARSITYPNGTVRMHARIDGVLYRSDAPGVIIGTEVARTVRAIDGTVAQVTGNRWHIVIYGAGMTAHDVGRIYWDFTTGEVFAESGNHPIFDGEFDFSVFCSL